MHWRAPDGVFGVFGGTALDGATRPTSSPGHRPDPGADRGLTLIEIVVTVTLLAVIVVPILTATVTLTGASSTSRQAANVETALINAVDRINRAPSDECDYTRYAEAALQTQGWSSSQASVSHAYLDGGSWAIGPAGAAACPVEGDRPLLIKLVRVTVTSPDGTVTRSIEVVKSEI